MQQWGKSQAATPYHHGLVTRLPLDACPYMVAEVRDLSKAILGIVAANSSPTEQAELLGPAQENIATTQAQCISHTPAHARLHLQVITVFNFCRSSCAGDERMMSMQGMMKMEEPERDVRWPSPARSDSEYEEGPPRQGQKRHPKVRLKAKAVRRLERKRAQKEASELPSTAAADVAENSELQNQQTARAPARAKKRPVLNKVCVILQPGSLVMNELVDCCSHKGASCRVCRIYQRSGFPQYIHLALVLAVPVCHPFW